MEQDPKQRPGSATELVGRLEQLQHPQRKVVAEPSSVPSPSVKEPRTTEFSAAEQARKEWEANRLAQFTALYKAAQNLVLQNAEEALQKLAEARKMAPDLCDDKFPGWVLYAQNQRDIQKEQEAKRQAEEARKKEAQRQEEERKAQQENQRRQKFTELYEAGQELAHDNLQQALQKLTEAHQFAPDLCDDEFRQWWADIVEEQRRQQFNGLYETAQELAQTNPEQALQKLTEVHQFAPDLCDDTFHQWWSFAEHKQSKAAKPRSFLSRLVSTITTRPAPALTRVKLLLADQFTEINKFRPDWLPNRVARRVRKESIPGPQSGGCLVYLPELPRGIERKVILDRGGNPLLEMVKIPAGEFLMGTDPNGQDPYVSNDWVKKMEMPQKRIYLEDYWIARTPVTNQMWRRFQEESGYNPPGEDHGGGYRSPGDQPHHPMIAVSYINAWAFCDFYGLMLPCEAQWEKAARGRDGRIYPWGNQKPEAYLCNVDRTIIRVNVYPHGMSVYGLLHCSGNVRELCADAWDESWLQKITNENVVCKNSAKDSSVSCRGGSLDYVAGAAVAPSAVAASRLGIAATTLVSALPRARDDIRIFHKNFYEY